MKHIQPETARKPGISRGMEPPAASAPATPDRQEAHSHLALAGPGAEVLLERCFRELVNFYRHSCAGRLCRGIVHRMSTPLQVLSFLLELLEAKSLEEGDLFQEIQAPDGGKLLTLHRYRFQKIRQFRLELDILRDMTRNLILQGGHEDDEDCRELDLNEICRRELDLYLAHPFFKHQVEKEFHFQEDLPPVKGYYVDFSQSFRSILENALEAMDGAPRRRLTVVTSLEPGRRLLRVGDTGPGIPPEIKLRIFEPFFTTKGAANPDRAGLGLFMARRLLAPYGGEIQVDSIPGETWVSLVLPAR